MVKKNVLISSVIQIVKRYGKQLLEEKIPFDQLIVFGSQAKGKAKPWSDIDVCVVSTVFGKNRHDERVRLMHARDDSLLDIEPHPFHPDELADKYDPLASEIRKYGIQIV